MVGEEGGGFLTSSDLTNNTTKNPTPFLRIVTDIPFHDDDDDDDDDIPLHDGGVDRRVASLASSRVVGPFVGPFVDIIYHDHPFESSISHDDPFGEVNDREDPRSLVDTISSDYVGAPTMSALEVSDRFRVGVYRDQPFYIITRLTIELTTDRQGGSGQRR